MADSYKSSHFKQYPEGTEYVYSYIEARAGDNPYTVVFGLQAFIQEYLLKPITKKDIDEACDIMYLHGVPFNEEGWNYILTEHGGYLPLLIKAVPEGTRVPLSNVLATVVNTDPKCAWLTSYMETAILRAVWYGTTVCTNSHFVKQDLLKFWKESSDAPIESVDFKLHDFGSRGVSSEESSALGGMSHLVNFKGTDTLAGLVAANKYYKAGVAGFSIPAAEHSTITSWGRDGELAAYRNMIEAFDTPMVAIVSDSYDHFSAIKNMFGGELRELIINSGKTVVIRPDSGNPIQMVSNTIEALMDCFGCSYNSKNYKVLPSCVRVLQGDGITPESIKEIIVEMKVRNLSIDNIAFGMGGGLLQMCNRDTYSFAMKCSAICVNGVWRDVYKQPKTDSGKGSKRGRLSLVQTNSWSDKVVVPRLTTVSYDKDNDVLCCVYNRGVATNVQKFQEIRNRANNVGK